MSEAFDWAEMGRIVGVGFGMVILILSGLAILLRITAVVIRKIQKKIWFEARGKLRKGSEGASEEKD
jgi:hypothetical protein